jgi:polyhydroxybutyrate depolymerase
MSIAPFSAVSVRLALLTGLCSLLAGAAQAAVLFQDAFASGTGQFTSTGNISTGSFGVRMRGGTNDGAITSPAISTVGKTGIKLTWDRDTSGLDSGEFGIAEFSVNNGASYTILNQSASTTLARVSFDLGAAAENVSQLRIRFRVVASSSFSEYNQVDNVVLEDGSGGPPPPTAGCGAVLTSGQRDCTTDGRDVNVFVPASYTGAAPVPLVVDMHGFTSNNTSQQNVSGWDDLATTRGFIVAYPQGISNSWNAQGQCCGSSTANDVQFIRNVVANIRSSANIDANRIYATGLSNGGSMTHTLACQAADLFAAASAVSFGLSGGSGTISTIVAACNPSVPIPVVHFHGTADGTVDYNGGVLDSLGGPDSLEAWRQIQSCSTASTTTQVTPETSCRTHAGCDGGVSVSLCSVQGGAHVLYPDVSSPGIPALSWDFFQQFP